MKADKQEESEGLVFRYTTDRRSRRLTWIVGILVVVVAVCFYFVAGTAYLSAGFLTCAVALILLFVLSIPRYIRVSPEAFEIHCVVELTTIHMTDIKSVKRVWLEDMRPVWPLLGSYGFGGYFGYYLDCKNWEIVKLYASQWDHFVMIEDIYEDKYIVSCDRPDELIDAIRGNMVVNTEEKLS